MRLLLGQPFQPLGQKSAFAGGKGGGVREDGAKRDRRRRRTGFFQHWRPGGDRGDDGVACNGSHLPIAALPGHCQQCEDDAAGGGVYQIRRPFLADPQTFDRTHVFTSSNSYVIPGAGAKTDVLGVLTNGWTLNGVISWQSGQPYIFIDYSGAVASVYNSYTVKVSDPIIGFAPGPTISQLKLQGTTRINVNQPLVDGSKLYIPTVAPGTLGVPPCATVSGAQVCDSYETSFSNFGRNTFRAPFQSRADLSLAKDTRINERLSLNLRFDVFNVFNHPDFDAANINNSLYSETTSGNAITKVTVKPLSSTFGLIQSTLGGPRIMMVRRTSDSNRLFR